MHYGYNNPEHTYYMDKDYLTFGYLWWSFLKTSAGRQR